MYNHVWVIEKFLTEPTKWSDNLYFIERLKTIHLILVDVSDFVSTHIQIHPNTELRFSFKYLCMFFGLRDFTMCKPNVTFIYN